MSKIKERPILFSGPMVRAILDGRKTMTRRVVKDPHAEEVDAWAQDDANLLLWRRGVHGGYGQMADMGAIKCPYGAPGERLWVRETWRPAMEMWRTFVEYKAGGGDMKVDRDLYDGLKRVALRFPGAREDIRSEVWHPSIHMPRWASRLTLEVVGVRVERLQDITPEDSIREGRPWGMPEPTNPTGYIDWFRDLWDTINGKRPGCSWADNPWVWVVEFKVVA